MKLQILIEGGGLQEFTLESLTTEVSAPTGITAPGSYRLSPVLIARTIDGTEYELEAARLASAYSTAKHIGVMRVGDGNYRRARWTTLEDES